jgi:hypothetical protein
LAPATLIAILILWPTVAPTLHLTSGEIGGEQRLFTWRDVHVLLKRFLFGFNQLLLDVIEFPGIYETS